MRQLVGAQQVDAADVGGAAAGLARRLLQQPLHDVGRFGAPGAAVGVDRGGVRHHAAHAVVDRRDAVDAADDLAAGHRLDRRPELRLIGAEIGQRVDLEREDTAIGVERELRIGGHRPAVGVALEGIAALAGPLDRAAEGAGGVEHQRIFGIGPDLHAEAAADVAGHDPNLRGLHPQHLGEHGAHAGDALAAGVEMHHAVLEPPDRGADLHRGGGDAVLDDGQPRDVRRARERRVGRGRVAGVPVEHRVRRRVGPDLRRAVGHRLVKRGDRGQLVEVDLDRLHALPRRLAALRDDEGDGVADEAHGVAGEEGPGRLDRAGERRLAGQNAVIGDV